MLEDLNFEVIDDVQMVANASTLCFQLKMF